MPTVSLRKFSQLISSRSSAALLASLLLAAACAQARAQAIGANRGDIGATGGTQVIQGHIISPLGKLPESRIRVTLSGKDVKVNVDGTFTVITDGLDRPTSLEFIGNTAYFVTLTGEIWKIDGVSCPH